jgi:hypothetical protein
MQHAVAESTKKVYQTGFECYCKYMRLSNVWLNSSMPPISEGNLMAFVTHCSKNLSLVFSTIKLYLCGIRHHYILAGSC